MRLAWLVFIFLLLTSTALAQRPLWQRVHSFEDSVIEINTQNVTLGGETALVQFRSTFDQVQTLAGQPNIAFQSKVEVFEIDCQKRRYRPFATAFFDAAGNSVYRHNFNTATDWQDRSVVMTKLMDAACGLISELTKPESKIREEAESEKVAMFSLSFNQTLEKTKDFKQVISQFFANDYINRYRDDKDTNWFFNLNPDTAAKATPAELDRFYVAVLNNFYLDGIYFASQSKYVSRGMRERDLIPSDVVHLIENHPYSLRYKGRQQDYEFLADRIDSVERLRSYTDLLERMAGLMRQHLIRLGPTGFSHYHEMLGDAVTSEKTTCAKPCLGFPKGTNLFAVEFLLFRLQLAEVNGKLKVVSLAESFH